ncbi:MAG: methyltransferase family protein [Alphaproteobacteria bacterium]
MDQSKPGSSSAHIPPPLLFLLGYIAGEGLELIVPLPLSRLISVRAGEILGAFFLALGFIVALVSVATFLAAKTTPIPYRRAATLVTWGPYRLSRNPMYVGVTLIYLGVAALRFVLWPVLLLPVALVVLNYFVIPQEESILRDAFGAAYEQYCARVRRWL